MNWSYLSDEAMFRVYRGSNFERNGEFWGYGCKMIISITFYASMWEGLRRPGSLRENGSNSLKLRF